MNKNTPIFRFISVFVRNCRSHIARSAWGRTVPGICSPFWMGGKASPRSPVPLGQDTCRQLGEQAVSLAATPNPTGIIYGTDFFQVVLQGWGGWGRPQHRGSGIPPHKKAK